MALTWRRRMRRGVVQAVTACLLATLILGVTPEIAAAGPGGNIPRVRSSSLEIEGVVSLAMAKSATFRDLVKTIEATDGIVYVEPGWCGHGVRGCLTHTLTPAGGYRILRVIVDTAMDVMSLMSLIGHELQHAIEVLTESGAKSSRDVFFFYHRGSPTGRDSFETPAAIRTEVKVELELQQR